MNYIGIDTKPTNTRVTSGRRVVLMDFGIVAELCNAPMAHDVDPAVASVMPRIVRAHPHATTVLIAERAAQFLREAS